ncbi:MAG: hypothetical protein R3F43_13350 [bacterium]
MTELVASNRGSLQDEDGETPDWIELYNPHPAPVDAGWFALKRRGRQARLATAGRGAAALHVSGGLRVGEGPARDWHTDFRLEAAGEGLWLPGPGGAVVQAFPAVVALGMTRRWELPGTDLSSRRESAIGRRRRRAAGRNRASTTPRGPSGARGRSGAARGAVAAGPPGGPPAGVVALRRGGRGYRA